MPRSSAALVRAGYEAGARRVELLSGLALTAAVASHFVKQERGAEHAELIEALQRIEADVAELRSRV